MIEKNEMIFGLRAVLEALEAGKEIDKILVKKDLQGDLAKELFAALKGTDIPVQRVPIERLNRITRKNHQGVIAYISAITYQKTEDLVPLIYEAGKNPFFLMLDGITDGPLPALANAPPWMPLSSPPRTAYPSMPMPSRPRRAPCTRFPCVANAT